MLDSLEWDAQSVGNMLHELAAKGDPRGVVLHEVDGTSSDP